MIKMNSNVKISIMKLICTLNSYMKNKKNFVSKWKLIFMKGAKHKMDFHTLITGLNVQKLSFQGIFFKYIFIINLYKFFREIIEENENIFRDGE